MTKQNLNIILCDEDMIIEANASTNKFEIIDVCNQVTSYTYYTYTLSEIKENMYKIKATNKTLYEILSSLAFRFTISIG